MSRPLRAILPHLYCCPLSAQLRKMKKFPEFSDNISPLDTNVYVNGAFHQSYHHFSKVVSTHYKVDGMFSRKNMILGYQMLSQSQIMMYDEGDVPEAKFNYDLSPMAVVVSNKGRRWYDFITSLCAIIGGTFTVVGLIDTLLHKLKGQKGL